MYADLDAANWDAVGRWMADDLVIHEPDTLPYGGDWTGRDAMERLFQLVMGYWDDPVLVRTSILGNEQLTVTLVDLTITSKVTGNRFTTKISETTHYRDGKVAEIDVFYFDPERVAKEAGPKR